MGLIEHARTGGDVVHVRLNRPEWHNALVPEMWQRLAALGAELVRDDAIRCVVVSGEGASFCTGIDRRALADGALTPFGLTGDDADRERTEYEERDIVAAQATARWLYDGDFVSIAAVRGFALGAGAQISMACDVRIVGTDATFALPEVEIGLFPEMAAVAVLPRIVGYDRAIELALTGRRFDAAAAQAMGLVTELVEPDDVVPAALRLAEQIAGANPIAIRSCKRAMRLGASGDVDGALRVARQGGLQCLKELITAWSG